MEMKDAISSTLIAEIKTALAAFFPSIPAASAAEYVNERSDEGSPTAMAGQWYVSVGKILSRERNDKPGQPYVREEWNAELVVTVRSAYAADDRIDNPQTLMNQLTRAITSRLRDRSWEILTLINAAFASATTNGLTIPFLVRDPLPARTPRMPQWLKAFSAKKGSQIPALSATIALTGAEQIQVVGGIA